METKDILQAPDIVKIYKIPLSKWHGKSTYQPTNVLKMQFMTSIKPLQIWHWGAILRETSRTRE